MSGWTYDFGYIVLDPATYPSEYCAIPAAKVYDIAVWGMVHADRPEQRERCSTVAWSLVPLGRPSWQR